MGHYYMLSKVFVAADTPMEHSKVAQPPWWINLRKKSQACTLSTSSMEKLYNGLLGLLVTGHTSTIAYHDGLDHENRWQEYCNKCFCMLLMVPKSGHVILPSQLTGISGLTQAVFKAEQEYGQCCMLFRMGKPTHFVPLGMTEIRVFGSIVPQ